MTNIRIVIGGNFGDEGKGLMTDYFTREMMRRSGRCLNVLSNGGAQRGHTVVAEQASTGKQVRHVFRHFGSGTFAGADTYFPSDFILNPMIFMKEIRELEEKLPEAVFGPEGGPDGRPEDRRKLFVHPDCPVTTPFEMLANLILEESRGKKRHGSVGVGIWETVIGNGKKYGELVRMTPAQRKHYMETDRKERMYKRLRSQGIDMLSPKWEGIANDPGLIRHYLEDLEEMAGKLILTDDKILRQYDEIIFENGQGLLLDRTMKRKGYGEHTTPSNTGIKNPVRIMKEVYGKEAAEGQAEREPLQIEAVYVTRSYMTRHGAGRFDTECPKEEINASMTDMTNQPNKSQGSLRYGTLNLTSLLRRVRRDFGMLEEELKAERMSGSMDAEYAVAMTHLNEFAHPGSGHHDIKYKSFSETGKNCVILQRQYHTEGEGNVWKGRSHRKKKLSWKAMILNSSSSLP